MMMTLQTAILIIREKMRLCSTLATAFLALLAAMAFLFANEDEDVSSVGWGYAQRVREGIPDMASLLRNTYYCFGTDTLRILVERPPRHITFSFSPSPPRLLAGPHVWAVISAWMRGRVVECKSCKEAATAFVSSPHIPC